MTWAQRLKRVYKIDVETSYTLPYYWDGPLEGRSITVDEIKQAVGDYISFEFAE